MKIPFCGGLLLNYNYNYYTMSCIEQFDDENGEERVILSACETCVCGCVCRASCDACVL